MASPIPWTTNHNLSLMNPNIGIFQYPWKKKKSTAGKNLVTQYMVVSWYWPDHMEQPLIIALLSQVCRVGTKHDGCIRLSSYPDALITDHMTFLHCSIV